MGKKSFYKRFWLAFALLCSAAAPIQARGRRSTEVIATREQTFSAPRAIGHYIGTHKLPLAVDALVVLANAADAASTLRAAHYCPSCIDYALGRNPSPAKTWGELMSFSAGLVAFNQLAYHHYREGGPEPSWGGQKFFVLMFSVPVIIHAAADVRINVQVGPSSTDLARKRLMAR
ncbi:MAG TPA: hypothetical protein VFW94_20275 [Candidatus Acidoferrales bacterium]|nr:hypothetical protein [Candidatus Acidoferrales bacterium]